MRVNYRKRTKETDSTIKQLLLSLQLLLSNLNTSPICFNAHKTMATSRGWQ